jgi:hypothetical protein
MGKSAVRGALNRPDSRKQPEVKEALKEQVRVKVVSRREQPLEVPRKAEVEESEGEVNSYIH